MANRGRMSIDSMRRQIKASIIRMEAKGLDDETRADLARFLCVRVSGLVERAFRELVGDLAQQRADPRIAEYVVAKVSRVTNLDANGLLGALETLDTKWAGEVRQLFDDDPSAKDALNSIVAGRHRLAHGHDHGVSPNNLKLWYAAVDRIVQKLEDLIDP